MFNDENEKTLTVNLSLNEYINLHYFKTLLQNSAVVKLDLEGNITYANEKFCSTTGYTKEEILKQNHKILHHSNNDKNLSEELWTTIQKGDIWHGRFLNKKKMDQIFGLKLPSYHSLTKMLKSQLSI